MTDYDHAYKLLFSHPEMVRDLLVGFVHEDWVGELDYTTLERVEGSFVSQDLRERENDIIWRVRFRDDWLYLYLLLEFQSVVDNTMAVRVMTYLGLLYQDILRQNPSLSLSSPEQKLPPVLPIVLYNGTPRWQAATEIQQIIHPGPGQLARYVPQVRYLLLDEGAIDESAPYELKNLVAAVFRLEHGKSPQDFHKVLTHLIEWMQAPEQDSLRRAFTTWLNEIPIKKLSAGHQIKPASNLLEVRTMLAETIDGWTQQWKQQGIQQGMQHEAAMLERQITRRFGSLPEQTRARLANATFDQFDIWADRILDAKTLEEVFGQGDDGGKTVAPDSN